MQAILTILTVLGAALTVYGLVRALTEARNQADLAEKRVAAMQRIADDEKREHAAVNARREAGEVFDQGAENERVNKAYEAKYAEWDIIRPNMGNVGFLAAFESRRLVSLVLGSTRRDFTVAIVGVLVSTVASVWSLYIS